MSVLRELLEEEVRKHKDTRLFALGWSAAKELPVLRERDLKKGPVCVIMRDLRKICGPDPWLAFPVLDERGITRSWAERGAGREARGVLVPNALESIVWRPCVAGSRIPQILEEAFMTTARLLKWE